MDNNEAFQKWLKQNYPDYPPPLSEVQIIVGQAIFQLKKQQK